MTAATVASYVREQPGVLARQLTSLPSAAADALRAAGAQRTARVLLVGSGTSHHAARLAASSFARPVRVLVPTDALHFPGDLVLGPDLLVVGVSQSGRSTGTLAVLERARAAGAATLLVTGEPTDDRYPSLDIACGPEGVGAKTKGCTGTVMALHLLARALDDADPDSDLGTAPDAVAAAVARAAAPIAGLVTAPTPTEVHVVTWGPWRPVADEGALKILETARVPVEVWDVEEFLHGPHRRLHPGSLLVVVGGHGPLADRADRLARFVVELGGRALHVIAGGLASTGAGEVRIALPEDGDAARLAALVPLQLLAIELTGARGLSPEEDVFPDFHARLGSKEVPA
ncbi:SIS domain-containing protein [Cellulomonas soli]|uniref:SIS domain-containing protein n=1 Tax=Cellulomonas soli TaxID=931535 RepID=UPI003F845DD8